MKLFDFIKIFFGENPEYYKLKKYDKGKNRFMINRFMSINYPTQAEMLNLNGTDPAHIVESWHLVARNFKRTPGWMYTKVRKAEPKPGDGFVPSDETVKFYMNKFKISYKDFETCVKFNKAELYNELEELEKEMQSNKDL
jgi:hypothetical protein